MKLNIFLLIGIFAYLLIAKPSMAGPTSTHFELQEYGFGAGGTDTTMNSTNFKMFGTVGEVESGRPFSELRRIHHGVVRGAQPIARPAIRAARRPT